MCWVALDRAIRLADRLGAADQVEHWHSVREEIRQAIETKAWSEEAGAFAQSFGSDDLDASALMLLIAGFLPPTDVRMKSTVDAIASRLTDERGLVYRYLAADGLPGDEGTFTLCTFWLVECFAMLGELDRAHELFERVVAYANDVGLFAEEIDPATGEALGNFPQAFTHIGLVNAAWAISLAEQPHQLH
jgi:GH15 family glucan-1,4-alpha-glucosidase